MRMSRTVGEDKKTAESQTSTSYDQAVQQCLIHQDRVLLNSTTEKWMRSLHGTCAKFPFNRETYLVIPPLAFSSFYYYFVFFGQLDESTVSVIKNKQVLIAPHVSFNGKKSSLSLTKNDPKKLNKTQKNLTLLHFPLLFLTSELVVLASDISESDISEIEAAAPSTTRKVFLPV